MPTAMMPFYGQTPEEAAHQLAAWLSLAHRRQASQPVLRLQTRARVEGLDLTACMSVFRS